METRREPLLPWVSEDDIMAFRSDDPQTYTRSELVNRVLLAMEVVGLASRHKVARYLALDATELSGALKIVTGHNLQKFGGLVVKKRKKELEALHPEWGSTQLAQAMGFADRTGMWRHAGGNQKRRKRVSNEQFEERLRMYDEIMAFFNGDPDMAEEYIAKHGGYLELAYKNLK